MAESEEFIIINGFDREFEQEEPAYVDEKFTINRLKSLRILNKSDSGKSKLKRAFQGRLEHNFLKRNIIYRISAFPNKNSLAFYDVLNLKNLNKTYRKLIIIKNLEYT